MSAAAICALALALAAVNTIFTLANGIFLRPLPFDAARSRRPAQHERPARAGANAVHAGLSYPELAGLARGGAHRCRSIGVYTERRSVRWPTIAVAPRDGCRRRDSSRPTLFDLIGRQPSLGRDFSPADDACGRAAGRHPRPPRLAVALRRREPGVIGRTVRVNGRQATVVGMMPPASPFRSRSRSGSRSSALTDAQRTSRTGSRSRGCRPHASRRDATTRRVTLKRA